MEGGAIRRVAVIGGGAAGLAAAQALAAAQLQVTMYERAARAGGMLRTELIDGARVDTGVQLVSTSHTALQSLAQQAGAAGLLRRSPGRDALWRRDRAHALTYGSVASMATSGALPASLKLKLAARYVPFLATGARTLDANDPSSGAGATQDTESIAAWGRRELGDDFVELLAYPLLAAYYGALPEETTAPFYHALARLGMDVAVLGAAGGFGALVAALVRALEQRGTRVVTNAHVTGVEVLADGVRVAVRHASLADDVVSTYDVVVIATPAPHAAELLAPYDAAAAWLRQVRVRSTFTTVFRTTRSHPGDYFGLSFPRSTDTGRTIAALCVQSRKLPGLVPAGGDALVALPAPVAARALLERTDDAVIAALLGALDGAFGGLSRRVASAHVYRFDDACTLFETGHLKRIRAFDESVLPSRVALAGAYLVAPTVEGAVRSGARAARRLLRG